MAQDPWAAFAPQEDPFAAFNPQKPTASPIDELEKHIGTATGDYGKKALSGALYAGQRASAGLTGLLPNAVRKYLESKGLSPSEEQLAASKQATVDAGVPGMAGQMATDVGMQMLPSSMLSRATAGLTAARGVAAELAGQGGINAAFTPDSEGRGMGAAIGAGGAATGCLLYTSPSPRD